ncbi:cell division protein FtsZ [Mesomycoplasma flocculare]|uniref:Cell division protein FtsZ n=3 Tax=Mesomycoplasma flocculare TaxID=2128 RepID=A0A0A8E6H7_MESFC|nr:cell division protein FtsZ [Mesomycoplasma flocculare]AJC49850.1 cell division protein FtsZ [Mesomycoplasma flocculare ATCC 27399]MXR39510.1 cell division protein FtsZ [Mycoplasma sp. MF12]MXR05964.1 cell division protein FtsZ [Mesomycoplasma flocculare]MXR12331.1 cell division protein FtsZ [Mesomycoplasma flocculare]MXR13638.1 cell division protein FtsZ [Mesomycoplasma flocculare]
MEKCSKIMLMGLGDFGSKVVKLVNLDQASFPKFFINSRDEYTNFNFNCKNSLTIDQSNFKYNWQKASKALSDKSLEIKSILVNVRILFLVVGLGGATGSGAALTVAKIAKDMGIIVIILATNPLKGESKFRQQTSFDVLLELKKIVDSLIIISNEQISQYYSDFFLENVIRLITANIQTKIGIIIKALCQKNALVNVNNSIVESILTNNNFVFVASAIAAGNKRAVFATENAIKSHFIEFDLFSSEEMLITITANNSILQSEISDILGTIRKNFNSDLKFSYGVYHNPKLEDQIEIGIIANQKKHSYEREKATKFNLVFDNKFNIF